jgi:hypothetical protein
MQEGIAVFTEMTLSNGKMVRLSSEGVNGAVGGSISKDVCNGCSNSC